MSYFKIKAPPKGPATVPVNPAQEEDTNSGVDDGESAAANDDDSDDFSNSSFDDEISDGILPKAGQFLKMVFKKPKICHFSPKS